MPASASSLATIAKFFRRPGESLSAFSAEWKTLPKADQDELRAGFENGSLTY